MKKRGIVWGAVGATAALLVFGLFMTRQPTELNAFAECIAETDTTFYGAFWCPHCQDQNSMFGGAKDLLPYVECSTPDGQGQLQVCVDAGIQSYPTWDLPDGSRATGVLSLERLSEATGCPLPKDN